VRCETATMRSPAGVHGTATAHTACGRRSGGLQRDYMYSCDFFLQNFDTHLERAHTERDRDPMVVPRLPVVVPDPRSRSIDPGSRSQPSIPFPATMGQRAWPRRGAAGDARKGMGEEITSPRRFTSSATANTCFQLSLLRFYRCIWCHE
jgi:hypothetical protein